MPKPHLNNAPVLTWQHERHVTLAGEQAEGDGAAGPQQPQLVDAQAVQVRVQPPGVQTRHEQLGDLHDDGVVGAGLQEDVSGTLGRPADPRPVLLGGVVGLDSWRLSWPWQLDLGLKLLGHGLCRLLGFGNDACQQGE